MEDLFGFFGIYWFFYRKKKVVFFVEDLRLMFWIMEGKLFEVFGIVLLLMFKKFMK